MKRVEDFKLTTSLLRKLYVNRIIKGDHSQNLGEILSQHPKLLVALNHGPMAGAFAGLIGLASMFEQYGGDQRRPFGITWRTFYQLPISKQIFSYLTQVDKGVNFDEANALLSGDDFTDCFIMPEGELCNFGDGEEVQPFLSPRFVELAILNECPVLVAVHLGSEKWARPVAVNDHIKPIFNWLPKNMKQRFHETSTVSVPKLFRKKLNNLYMSFYLYQPELKTDDLSDNKTERMGQLKVEAECVRVLMQSMIDELQEQREEKRQLA